MSLAIVCEGTSAPRQLKRWVVLGGMGPGAPGFARAHPIADTGKLSLAHATLRACLRRVFFLPSRDRQGAFSSAKSDRFLAGAARKKTF